MKTNAPALRCKEFLNVCSALIAVAAVVVCATLTNVSAQERPIRIERFDLSQNGRVKVENFRGSTRVEVWNERGVKVVAEKKKPGDSTLKPTDLKLMGMNSEVTVECEQNGEADRVDLTVFVPQNSQLQVTGGAWPVEVIGSVESAVIKTTSGDIGYHLSPSDNARVAMHSSKGVVRSAMQLAVDQKVGLRTLEGTIGDGSSPIMMNSGSGNITLMPSAAKIASVVSNDNGELQLRKPPRNGPQSENQIAQQGRQSQEENSIAVPPGERGNSGSSNASGTQRGYTPDYDAPAPTAVRSGAGSGETVFAGQGHTSQSSTTIKSGGMIIPRPITKNDTGEDSMGLKVRIIPSDSTSGGAGDPRYPNQKAEDQIYRDNDQGQDAQGADSSQSSSQSSQYGGSRRSSSQSGNMGSGGSSSSSNAPPSVSGSNSDFGLAGSAKAEDSKSTTVTTGGLVPRPRTETDAREDNMGLRVRIIPSGATAGGAGDPRYPGQRDEDNIYPQGGDGSSRSNGRSSSILYDSATDNGSSTGSNSQPSSTRPTARRQPLPPDDDEMSEPNPSGSGRPARASGGNDAIVLTSSLVSFNVSVTDRTGKILSGLNKGDFSIYENNQPQQVDFFAPSTAPFNLVLLLDLSGSISDRLDVVKAAAQHFIDILGPQDKIAIATFTRQVTVLSQLTSDRDLLRKRIKSIKRPEGGTAFYEAMWFSLAELLRGTQGQRNAIVVVSDGVDNSLDRFNPANSRVSFPQLARKLELSDAMVFPIYVDTEYEEVFERGNTTSEAYAIARDQLARMANITGGEMFKAQTPEDIVGVYNQVADAIRTVYSVGYYPTDAQRDGTYRRVNVQVDKPDATVRTRRGYYAN